MPGKEKIPRRLRRRRGRRENEPGSRALQEAESDEPTVLGFGKTYDEFAFQRGRRNEPQRGAGRPKDLSDKLFEQMQAEEAIRHRARNLTSERMKAFQEKHNRMPSEAEAGEIAESIFVQAKEEFDKAREMEKEAKKKEREQQRMERDAEKAADTETPPEPRGRGRRTPHHRRRGKGRETPEKMESLEKATPTPASSEVKSTLHEVEGMSVEGLFDEEKKPAGEKTAKAGEGGSASTSLEEDLKLIGMDEETPAGEKEGPLFCPECGAEFTDASAAGKEEQEDGIKYTCPQCKKPVKVKK